MCYYYDLCGLFTAHSQPSQLNKTDYIPSPELTTSHVQRPYFLSFPLLPRVQTALDDPLIPRQQVQGELVSNWLLSTELLWTTSFMEKKRGNKSEALFVYL